MKRNTANTAMRVETRRKMRSFAFESYPITEPIKKMGMEHKAGCKREEKNVLLKSAKDVVENTSKRSVNAP